MSPRLCPEFFLRAFQREPRASRRVGAEQSKMRDDLLKMFERPGEVLFMRTSGQVGIEQILERRPRIGT